MKMTKISTVLAAAFLCLVFCFPVPAQETERETQQAVGSGTIGIISAMNNEINLLLENTDIDHVDHIGGRDFHVGELCGRDVVITRAGIGKVRSAAGCTTLINYYQPSAVLFTGVAGGVGDATKVLDVVVASDLVQHDYGTITNEGFSWAGEYGGEKGHFLCDPVLASRAYDAAVSVVGGEHVFLGTIATGDQFIASAEYVEILQEDFNAIACEMEGASVAAVCSEFEVPFVVIRTMSDKADGQAHEVYKNMADTAADNSCAIVMEMLPEL